MCICEIGQFMTQRQDCQEKFKMLLHNTKIGAKSKHNTVITNNHVLYYCY